MPKDRTKRLATRARRKRNREEFLGALDASAVEYEDLNNGAHIRIKGGYEAFPSRNAWTGPNGKGWGGVYGLIQTLGVDPHQRFASDPTPRFWQGVRP